MVTMDGSLKLLSTLKNSGAKLVAYGGGQGLLNSRLFSKYMALIIGTVSVALLINSGSDAWFNYSEQKTAQVHVQHEQAEAAAAKIGQFMREIEAQVGWTTQLQWSGGSIEQRRFDAQRLLRQVSAITELTQIDANGREQLKVSRLAMDKIGSGEDLSSDVKFTRAVAAKIYYGPVYFRRESEPYMTLSVAGTRRDAGVSVAEVNLKLIWDIVTQIKVGKTGRAYVVDADGRLIAHPDISLVLRNTDLSGLAQIKAARAASSAASGVSAETIQVATDTSGQQVLTASAPVPALGWQVFVELPSKEAYAPLFASVWRSGLLLLVALMLASLAGIFFARRLIEPIQALTHGARKIGAGELSQRISVKTGDELEGLANQFNDMAEQLSTSYANLEDKVEARTRDLGEALAHQTATSEVLNVISRSPHALEPVLDAIVATAARLCEADTAQIMRPRDANTWFTAAMYDHTQKYVDYQAQISIPPGRGSITGRVVLERKSVQITDVEADPEYALHDAQHLGRYRTHLGVPLFHQGKLIGIILLSRFAVRSFDAKHIELAETFASQAVIAINNSGLFEEVQIKTQDLARSNADLRALSDVAQAVNSSLDTQTVLETIVSGAVKLAKADAGAIFRYRRSDKTFRLAAASGLDKELLEKIQRLTITEAQTGMGEAAKSGESLQIPDLANRPSFPLRDASLAAGYHATLVVPLIGAQHTLGALTLQRRETGKFPSGVLDLMQTFANQSVLAIQNARLFREIAEKSAELESASRHKSQFLANMSHELRTPLNAILGYTELIADGIYGDLPARAGGVLERVQSNGRHLLGLINDILDLAKIEAGQMTMALEDYAVASLVQTVMAAAEPLAAAKSLKLAADVQEGMPMGRGDGRRLSQVLLNLVGNAVKFTDAGEVRIEAAATNGRFKLKVIDTGPGIAAADQVKIFEEFSQVDDSSTRKKGGTGLGLAISKRIVEMHGGRIRLVSEVGRGSTFEVSVPMRVDISGEAAE